MDNPLFEDIRHILHTARAKTYSAINFAMVEAYWKVGRRIVEEEQQGRAKAGYGERVIKELSKALTKEFGKGFTVSGLRDFRQFFLIFSKSCPIHHAVRGELDSGKNTKSHALRGFSEPDSKILYALRRELTWTHYRLLMRVENKTARDYYINEAANQNWSTRQLERNINSFYYERTLSTRNKKLLPKQPRQAQQISAPNLQKPTLPDFIKDPYVLEFLDLPDNKSFSEAELETAIIDNLQKFLLELGKGFSFIGRQYRITTETKHFFIDLVFYNHILKCFVLVDLKIGELTHQDIGQMDMYVRLFEDKIKNSDDNPTIGIVLCSEKDATIVKYSVLEENRQLFATKYKLVLPSEDELKREIERWR